jgi:methionyl aminopeptidase
MIELKSPTEIQRMQVTGQFLAQVLTELSEIADVGVNLLELEHHARSRIHQRGAQSCYWDYAPSFGNGPFRNVICLSVNDAVLHGLPRDYALRDGDLLSMDLAVGIDGWIADAARSVIVGTPADEDLRLVRATQAALDAGITAAQPGNRLGDISAAIGAVAHDYGYPVNTEFGGHGVGRTMHEDPHVPNNGRTGRGLKLMPGLTIALEPWFARTTDQIAFDPDGWTIRAADGSRTAHSEHTVAITDDGPVVLTRPLPEPAAVVGEGDRRAARQHQQPRPTPPLAPSASASDETDDPRDRRCPGLPQDSRRSSGLRNLRTVLIAEIDLGCGWEVWSVRGQVSGGRGGVGRRGSRRRRTASMETPALMSSVAWAWRSWWMLISTPAASQ